MNLETFFEKFELVVDALGAVAKMREFVLQLAVKGKLSGQPTAWTESSFGEVARLRRGYDLPKQDRKRGSVPIFAANGPVGVHEIHMVKGPGVVTGRSGSIGKVHYVNENFWPLNTALYVEDFFGNDPQFICLLLRSLHLERFSTATAVPTLNRNVVHKEIVKIPPLAEQKRIVAKVDELMALCDRLEAQQQERETRHAALTRASLARFADAPTPENLNFLFHPSYTITPADLRKSILTLAVQGKLVPQDPNDESAAELLAGIAGDIAKAVRAKRVRNSRHIPPHEGEFPFELPVGWAWAPLVNLTVAEDGAMCDGPFGSKLKTEHYIPTKGYAVLRLGNIGAGYFIHGKEGHISREHFESLPSNHCAPGDLLVAGLADPLVRCCEIPPDIGPAVNKSDCFRVRLSKRMERSYVRHYLNSPIAKAFAAEENHGMTRERINLASAKALPVPVPPFAEQRRIVTKVEQLLALVDALETQLAASRVTAANLLSTLVAELTGNPNNRHASVSPATGSGRRGRPRKT